MSPDHSKPMLKNVKVISRENAGPDQVVLAFEEPGIAGAASPGQFINISCDQFLRRPIGIMDTDESSGIVKVGIRVQGRGTRWLAERQQGDMLSILGPLGNGFKIRGCRKIITVGGGTGVFPLYFVHQECRRNDIESVAICGYRSRNESVLTDEFSSLGCQVLFASDTGDMDISGHAGNALEHYLAGEIQPEDTCILTCGPRPMMHEVWRLAQKYNLSCQVSLEERMACGIGACLVCTCEISRSENHGTISHERCCVEGPVFSAEEVVW